jgi:hypothetical protein
MSKSNWVMDIETMTDFFCAVFIHYKTEEQHVFIVSRFQNDFLSLMKFLKQNKDNKEYHISFNGIAFDSIVIQFILDNYQVMLKSNYSVITSMIYTKAQEVIEAAHSQRFYEFIPRNLMIKQIDVFKLNHWDNPAKSSSLKWIQYTMDWENMEEMPISHRDHVDTLDKQKMIVDYCINDVLSTKQIMNLSSSQINLRATLTKEYKIDLYSASEPRISKELFKHFLSEKTGIPKWELNKLRTKRDKIIVKDIILPYIKFKTNTFNEILEKFKKLSFERQIIKLKMFSLYHNI